MRIKLFFLFLLFCMSASAIKVDGIVFDENKQPIIGATIMVKGTTTGTSTDIEGKFSIKVDNVKTASLSVSFIGYKTKLVQLKGKTIIDIFMEPEFNELNEVLVVGYGSMKKSDITGSVVSVKSTKEEAARATSFDKMLQGKAAGLVVSTGSSAPGGAVNVRIRGAGSLRGDNSPLYVVDGVIVSNMGDTSDPMKGGKGGGNSLAAAQNPLSAISPQDIESIEVLKDASATAIYGSQGANGVILITTKKGKEGKASVVFSSTVTFSTLKKEIPMLSTGEYLEFYNKMKAPEAPERTMEGLTPINWQQFSTRTAVSQNYRASISGKSNKTDYYIATGIMDNEGIIKNTNIKQYDIRLNLNQEVANNVNLSTNTFFSSLNTSMTSGTDKLASTRSSIVRHMISYRPFIGETADLSGYDDELTGPDAWFKDYDDNSEDRLFNTNLKLDIKPLKWLTIQLKGGLLYRNKERSMWTGTSLFNGAQTNGIAGISTLKNLNYNAEALMMFDKKINKHSLSGTIGTVYNNKQITQTGITGENFFAKDLRADGISMAAMLYPFQYGKIGEQLFSALSRAVYSYDNKYVFTGTFRADGSSKFEKGNKFSYFPSFAFAWRANEENFLKDIKEISNLKVRLGWGQVGNQAISPYQTLASYNNTLYSKPDGSNDVGIRPARIANPNLKWETSEQYNVGFDLGLFNQKVNLTVDAYIKRTKDLLQDIAIPYSTGFANMWINKGVIENKGLEFTVQTTPVQTKNFRWDIGGNLSLSSNKIISLGISPTDMGMLKNVSGYLGAEMGNNNYTKFPVNLFIEGQPAGIFLGYQTNGIMQQAQYDSQDPTKRLSFNGGEILPGDILYVDQNGDGVVNSSDRVIVGDPNPSFVYALNTSLSYKNWNLDLTFNGVHGNDILNANLIEENNVINAQNNIRKDAYYQAWTPENMSNTYPKLGYKPVAILSDRIVEDGSYFRLSNVALSYNLHFKKKSFINSLTFTANASNLFTITKYSGYDPDVNTFSNDADRIGIDLTSYPASRNYTFGIIANF